MRLCVVLIAACGFAAGAEGPRIFYSKSFPGSVPPYVQIILQKTGDVEYREAADDDNPLKFHLTEMDTQQVFDLAEKLDYFKHPLEAPVKVAFMGAKTFRYENGSDKSEVKFNYSQDPLAQALSDWFERMAESAARRIDLERAAKYDKLGVVKALLLLEMALDKKRLLATEQYLPMLDRIAKNDTYMHTAQARAAEIAEGIRSGKL